MRPCWWARGRARGCHGPWRRSRSRLFVVPLTPLGAFIHGHTGQDAAEIAQRLADADPASVETELPNRAFVLAAAFLHDRNGLSDFAFRFEIAQENHGVGQVAGVHGCIHLTADEALVRPDQDRGDASL